MKTDQKRYDEIFDLLMRIEKIERVYENGPCYPSRTIITFKPKSIPVNDDSVFAPYKGVLS